VASLAGLKSAGRLEFTWNAALTSLDGLEQLVSGDSILISGNNALVAIDALGSLTAVESLLSIRYNEQIPDCVAFAVHQQLTELPEHHCYTPNLADACSNTPGICNPPPMP